ncbi:MAG: hypothetical protein EZS28_023870, partial [Streblomastix strix]
MRLRTVTLSTSASQQQRVALFFCFVLIKLCDDQNQEKLLKWKKQLFDLIELHYSTIIPRLIQDLESDVTNLHIPALRQLLEIILDIRENKDLTSKYELMRLLNKFVGNVEKNEEYVLSTTILHVIGKFEPYVVILNCVDLSENGDLPLLWNLSLYRSLPYAYKKNLKRILIIKPTRMVRTILVLARPFISSKFYRKIEFLDNLKALIPIIRAEQLQL